MKTSKQQWPVEAEAREPMQDSREGADRWVQDQLARLRYRAEYNARIWQARLEAVQRHLP